MANRGPRNELNSDRPKAALKIASDILKVDSKETDPSKRLEHKVRLKYLDQVNKLSRLLDNRDRFKAGCKQKASSPFS
jgi:hypothetical protein